MKPDVVNYIVMYKRDRNNYINKSKEHLMACHDNYMRFRYSRSLHKPQQELIEEPPCLPRKHYVHWSSWYDGYYAVNHSSQQRRVGYPLLSEVLHQSLEYNSQDN